MVGLKNMKDKALVGLKNWEKTISKEELPHLHKLIRNLNEDLKDNLTIMISGEFNAGKSTFINALLGEKVLTTDITPATAIITKLTYGAEKKVIAHYIDDSKKEYELSWVEQLTAEREGAGEEIRSRLAYVEYQLPNELLKMYTLIDSPGLTALHEHHSKVTESFMNRADIAIWLFNSLSVGTATELNWLKKMHSLEVPIYGVVNAIDRIDDEDLDAFLEYNVRRLQPYIKKLYGVSARDILDGKLNNDLEKIEWGNGQALEELFLHFNPVQLRKMEGFYRKLKVLLEVHYDFSKKKKASLEFVKDIFKFKNLQHSNYPELKEKVNILTKAQNHYESIIIDWEKLIKEKSNMENISEHIILNLKNRNELMNEWECNIKPVIEKSKKEYEELIERRNELVNLFEEIDTDWQSLKSSYVVGIQKTYLMQQEKKYNTTSIEWNQKKQVFLKNYSIAEKLVIAFNKELKKAINKEISAYQKEVTTHSRELKEYQILINREFIETNILAVKELQKDIQNTENLCNQILLYFKTEVPALTELSSYQQMKSLFNQFEKLYSDFDYMSFFKEFESFISYEPPLKVIESSLSIKSIPSRVFKRNALVDLPLSTVTDSPLPVVSPEPLSKKERLITEKKHTFSLGNIGLILLAIVMIIYANVSEDENEIPSETSIFDFVTSESEYSLAGIEPESGSESVENIYESEEVEKIADSIDEVGETVVEEPVIKEQSYLADSGSIQNFISTYRTDYEEALNAESFLNANKYINTEKPIYNEMLAYISSIKEEGLVFDFLSSSVTHVEEINLNRYSVMAKEEFYLSDNDDGSESYNERSKEYILEVTSDNAFLINDIITVDKSTEIIKEPVEEIIEETAAEPEEEYVYDEETSSLVTPEEVSQMMEQYYIDLELAFNDNGFSYIENYYAYDGEEYGPTAAYIAKAHKKNMVMKNHYISVENVEVYDDNHYLATLSLEDEYHYQDGDGDIKKIQADYLIRVTSDGEMKIEEIPSVEILEKIEF